MKVGDVLETFGDGGKVFLQRVVSFSNEEGHKVELEFLGPEMAKYSTPPRVFVPVVSVEQGLDDGLYRYHEA